MTYGLSNDLDNSENIGPIAHHPGDDQRSLPASGSGHKFRLMPVTIGDLLDTKRASLERGITIPTNIIA